MLAHPHNNAMLTLTTDASYVVVGAVLKQKQPDEKIGNLLHISQNSCQLHRLNIVYMTVSYLLYAQEFNIFDTC